MVHILIVLVGLSRSSFDVVSMLPLPQSHFSFTIARKKYPLSLAAHRTKYGAASLNAPQL